MAEFRDATPADAHAIANVLVESWRAAYRGLLPDEALASLSISDREQFWSGALTARQPHTGAVVATLAGTIVGFAATGPPLVPADRADPALGDLYALYLDPDVCGFSTPTNAPLASTFATAGPILDVPRWVYGAGVSAPSSTPPPSSRSGPRARRHRVARTTAPT